MTFHQYGVSAPVSQTSFHGETGVGVAKCRLFSQAKNGLSTRENATLEARILTERLYVRVIEIHLQMLK